MIASPYAGDDQLPTARYSSSHCYAVLIVGRRLLGVWEWDGMADGMDHGSAPLYAIAMCDNNLKCRWAVVSLRLL